MAQKKALERNHSLIIQSSTYTESKTIDELGEFVLKNGISGREHSVTLWGSGILEGEELQSIELYMNDPEEIVRLMDEGLTIDGAASDALTDYTLDDLIRTEEVIWPDIEKYAVDFDAAYKHEIPLKDIKVDLHDLIVKEEITDLLMKNDRAALSKEDLLGFGQLVKGDSLSYDVGAELKEPIEKILKEQRLEPGEAELMKNAFKSLSIDSNPDDFLKERSRSSPFSTHYLAARNQDEIEIPR